MVETLGATERRACRVIGQHRSPQRKPRMPRQDEGVLTAAIIALAERFGRYGYRRITALLRRDGWHVNEVEATVAEGRVSAADGLPHLAA